ncbi:MAG: Hpt domain-containing protein [Bacilli bacterium]
MKDINILKNNGVNLDASLDILGDIEMYNDTLNDFLEEIVSKVENLKTYKEADDMPNYAIYAHSVKSDSKYLGFVKLAEIAFNHEIRAKDNDIDYIKNNFNLLVDEINRVVQISKDYLN